MSNSETLSLLEGFFGEENVIKEWEVAKESQDALQKGLQYCPRIDFAIKPLNTDRNLDENRHLIMRTYRKYNQFFRWLMQIGTSNHEWRVNRNPRCFLAIECENKTSTKHRLGSLINACAIGNVGLVVTLNNKTYCSYERIVKYMEFLDFNEKLDLHPKNYIILKRNKFEALLRLMIEGRNKHKSEK